MQRRQFVTTLTAAAAILALKPSSSSAQTGKTLLVIELAGGNDGLNTFIPYTDPDYRKLRPDLGIQDGIPVTSSIALHPALSAWQSLLDQGQLAVVQNVGYPNPDLSHFRSKEIWQSGIVSGTPDSGWLARYLESQDASAHDAIFLGDEYPLALMGSGPRYLHLSPNLVINTGGKLGAAIRTLYDTPHGDPLAEQVRMTVVESTQAVQELTQDVDRRVTAQGYPQGPVGQQLALTTRLVESGAEVIYFTIGGWDTHTNQAGRHNRLLNQVGPALAALQRDLKSQGLDQNVLVMVQSEFGRRPAQNGSGGTDHGTAGPVIVMGPVKGGFYGGDPALDSLVAGNLPSQVDFRSLYAEIVDQWLGGSLGAVLDGSYPQIGVLA